MHELNTRAVREFMAIFSPPLLGSHQQIYLPPKLLINEKQMAADAQISHAKLN